MDSDDEETTLGIQIRGLFNELQLEDLGKKTLRGQIGQKEWGFAVGGRTFGYRMEIEPREARVVCACSIPKTPVTRGESPAV